MAKSLLTPELLAAFQAKRTITRLEPNQTTGITQSDWQDRVRGNVVVVEDTDRGTCHREMGFVLEAKAEVSNDDVQWRLDRHERINGSRGR